jgi:potassium-dependent mechanosensitive channel
MIFSRLARLLLLLILVAAPLVARAQGDEKNQLDRIRTELSKIEESVKASASNDAELVTIRGQVEPLLDQLRAFISEQQPRQDGIRQRLEQLGPRPDASKNQSEASEVARERETQEKAQREVEGVLALARNHVVSAEQTISRIADLRRGLLTKALMERSASIFSPQLWIDVWRSAPGEIAAARRLLGGWFEHVMRQFDITRGILLAVAIACFLVLAIPGRKFVRRFEGRPPVEVPEGADPKTVAALRVPRLKRVLAALRVTLIWAVIPFVICAGLYGLLDTFGLMTDRVQNILRTLLFGVAFVAFAYGLADGIVAPEDPDWRLVDIEDATASKITNLAAIFPAIIVAGKTVEALMQSIYAVLPVSIAVKAIFALLGGLAIIRTLRRLSAMAEVGDEPPASGGMASVLQAIRVGAWAVAAAIIIAAVIGYVALAGFLADQAIWLMIVVSVLLIMVILVDEYVGHGVSPDGAMGKQIVSQVGISKSSLKQISILSNGFVRLLLFAAAAMMVLAPWGLDGGDTFGAFKAAIFGFTVGGVTVSISTIVIGIAIFAIGFAITRAIKRWLEKSYLPHTKLDVGLRNSIATSIGYIGIVITVMMAASSIGLSLDKFTIVAGALSVGIGFGLQSIVNNFVSGLILLWERPIRVGDWIAVGDEQGIVKRINVRSTQIETFDRASLIVPNAEFISGRVKNWMHNDRIARVTVPIGVGYGSDPEKVNKLLLKVAQDHKEVMKEPHPRVYFMRLGDPCMEFELRCFVDVDRLLPVKSDLLYELLKRLRAANIDIPMPRRPAELLTVKEAENAVPDEIETGVKAKQ